MKSTHYAMIGLFVASAGGFFAGRISVGRDAPFRDDAMEQTVATGRNHSREPMAAQSPREPVSSLVEKLQESTGRPRASQPLGPLLRTEDAYDRYRMMLSFIDHLSPEEFEAVVAEFRESGMTEQRLGEYSMLLSAWAKVDPLAALGDARKHTESSFAIDTILATWASEDPESAIRWANENHVGDVANPFMPGIIRALATCDPVRATGLLVGMPRSVERGKALDGMLPSLLSQGNDATRRWIESLEDESLRNGAILRVAEKFAESEPEETLAWLRANPGEAANRRVDDVFRTWARNNEPAAMEAYRALPEGAERSNALRGIVSNLAASDLRAAVALMDQYPADVSERAARHFAWQAFGQNPSIAVDQIARIRDEGTREWMYRRLVGSWLRDDTAAASAWLQENAERHPVLEQLQQRAQQ